MFVVTYFDCMNDKIPAIFSNLVPGAQPNFAHAHYVSCLVYFRERQILLPMAKQKQADAKSRQLRRLECREKGDGS